MSTQQRGVPTQLEEEVLSHLMKVAVLVQGCWVLRSSLFYTEDYHSLYNSVPYTVMCVARDLIVSVCVCVCVCACACACVCEYGKYVVVNVTPSCLATEICLDMSSHCDTRGDNKTSEYSPGGAG